MPQQAVQPLHAEIPTRTHRWNIWVAGSEAAVYMTALQIMGPITLVPFLFRQCGIDSAWLGVFAVGGLAVAFGGPIGTAAAGGRSRKLPFCLRVGLLQRAPLLVVPLGAMFLFDAPHILLVLLVLGWMLSHFFGGVGAPVFQTMLSTGVRESWWGRMLSLRHILAAAAGLAATALVWWVNDRVEPPRNYVLLGWLGIGLLTLSYVIVSLFTEVPMAREHSYGAERLHVTYGRMREMMRRETRLRWLVLGRVVRSSGFLLGTYITAVFIERCGLTDDQMWIPVVMLTAPAVFCHAVAGWLIDHYGAKRCLVLSSVAIAVNSVAIMYCTTMVGFMFLYAAMVFGGSLLASSWPTILLKLAPREVRPYYLTTVTLAAAPGTVAILLFGTFLVHATGFDHVFIFSAAGGCLSGLIFAFKLPDIRHAPAST